MKISVQQLDKNNFILKVTLKYASFLEYNVMIDAYMKINKIEPSTKC